MQPNSSSLSTWLIIVYGAFKKSTAQTSANAFLKRQQLALKSWWKQLTWLSAKLIPTLGGDKKLMHLVHCSPEELGVRQQVGGGGSVSLCSRLHLSLVCTRKLRARARRTTPLTPSDWTKPRSAPARWDWKPQGARKLGRPSSLTLS